jgi:PEP-CTERM motif
MSKQFAWRSATALTFAFASASATAGAVTNSLDLGNAILTGDPTLSGYTNSYPYQINKTIDLSTVTAGSANGQVRFAYDPGIVDRYMGGYNPNGYSIDGSINLPGGFTVTGKDGVTLDNSQAGYRISGVVALSGSASVKLSTGESFFAKSGRSVDDVYNFTSEVMLNGLSGPLFGWSGSNPYAQGPNGTASVFSSASVQITRLEYFTGVQAVPEAGTWALMSMGMLGVAVAVRRRPK